MTTLLDALNTEVSIAVTLAEQLEDEGSRHTELAFTLLSHAEERLACALWADSQAKHGEWSIAWRGAVRAALKSRNPIRARGLIWKIKEQSTILADEIEMEFFTRVAGSTESVLPSS